MNFSLLLGLILLCSTCFAPAASSQSALDQYEKGLLAEREGLVAEAVRFYTKAINMESGNGAFFLSRANLIINNQNDPVVFNQKDKLKSYLACLEDYSKAVDLLPETYECYFGRAKVNYLLGNYDSAQSDYGQAVKLSYYYEDKIQALVGRGASQYRQGEIEGALRDLERAEDYDSTNVHVLNELALIYIQIDETEIALQALNKVLVRYPNDPTANANIGYAALKSGRYQKAMEIYNRYLKQNGPDAVAYSNLGFCKLKLGRLTGALQDLNKALELDPNKPFALKNRAMIHFALGNKASGCNDLHEAREQGYTAKYDNEVILLLGEHCYMVNQSPQ